MCVCLFIRVCVRSLPTLSLFVNMHTHICTKVGVGTYERVCECLDNLVSALLSRCGSVYLYVCVFMCVCEASLWVSTLKALWGFCWACL